jgi:hypothetical protein
MEKKKYHTVGTVPTSYREIVERPNRSLAILFRVFSFIAPKTVIIWFPIFDFERT